MTIAKLTTNLLSTLVWRNKINEVIDDIALKKYILQPLIADDGTEITHITFDADGLVDSAGANWVAAHEPPVQKIPMPAYAGDTTRNKLGAFSDSNYFTCGTSLLNFPTAPWIVAVEVDHVDTGAKNIIGCSTGGNGWMIQCSSGAGPYLLNGSFAGVQAPTLGGTMVKGRNTIICGSDGTSFFIKVNGSKTTTSTTSYVVPTGATGYIGRYVDSGYAYGGKIYEAWGSTDTPTVAVIDALYALSRKEDGNNYRFPHSSTTRFHFHAKNFATNTWSYYPTNMDVSTPTATLPTLTTVGTVPVTTEALTYPSGDGRYAIGPSGTPALLTANTQMYYLAGGADNVLNIATSFHGCMVLIPDAAGLETTQVFLASGYATASGGWQLVVEDNVCTTGGAIQTVFIGSTGNDASGNNLNGALLVADKLNIVCFGYDAANSKTYLKVNDYPTQIANVTISAVTPTGVRRDQAQLAGHNDMDIGYTGKTVECIVRSGVPSDEKFCALQREILSR